MGRLIEVGPRPTQADLPEGVALVETPERDDPLTRIAKLVPAEIVAGYVPLVTMAESIGGSSTKKFSLALGTFCLGLVATPIYLWFTGKPKNWVQKLSILLSTIAFGLWAYLLGGVFTMEQMTRYCSYDKALGGFIVLAFTWIAGLFPYNNLLRADENANNGG